MDAVAEEAGVTKQTVYRYYPSKIALFSALIGRFDDTEPEFFFGEASLAVELERYGLAFLAHHMQVRHMGFFRLMVAESRESGELGDVFRSQAQPFWFGKLSAFLSRFLLENMAADYAQLFNAMLLSKRTFLLMRGGEGMSDEEIRSHVDLVLELFLNGVPLK